MVGNGLLQWFLSKSSIGETETQKLPGHVFTGCLQSYTQQQGQRALHCYAVQVDH
ncbi:hypothetical protein VKT23_005240 [Stygiomarasmius scandens]|uniref:Uncharacterized protein n=1 Tax=Marasmiellus scandens TaxID=2682957 RepID=A0ABR1JQ86_9AGAR